MNEKLKNIFVPYNVAKLAFEKGFTEWCALVDIKDSTIGVYPNIADFEIEGEFYSLFDFKYKSDDSKTEYGIPTHFQLIDWLKDKHNIDVLMENNGTWYVLDKKGMMSFLDSENEFEINQALEVALNLLYDFQHDKQEYL